MDGAEKTEGEEAMAYLLSEDDVNPVLKAALEYADRCNRAWKRRNLTPLEATLVTLLRRVRELEQENAILRRLG